MHYPAGSARKYPLTANLRAHILSVRSPQPRYIVRGTKGTYTKFGIDVQEDQLKAMASPNGIFEDGFGREPEALWGTVENIEADDVSVRKTVWPSTDPGSQINLFRDLASAIRNRSELAVKWEEATAVIEIIQLAHLSAKEGKTVDVPKK
jgi:predicted dehydrogenase